MNHILLQLKFEMTYFIQLKSAIVHVRSIRLSSMSDIILFKTERDFFFSFAMSRGGKWYISESQTKRI